MALTEIHTSFHTLSLLYALPICSAAEARSGVASMLSIREVMPGSVPVGSGMRGRGGAPVRLRGRGLSRSEEHTSELQSLMRISYADYYLKKQKERKNRTHNDIHSCAPRKPTTTHKNKTTL